MLKVWEMEVLNGQILEGKWTDSQTKLGVLHLMSLIEEQLLTVTSRWKTQLVVNQDNVQ